MGKELDLLFTVTFGIIFWILGEHEPLLLPFFSLSSILGIGRDHIQSERINLQ